MDNRNHFLRKGGFNTSAIYEVNNENSIPTTSIEIDSLTSLFNNEGEYSNLTYQQLILIRKDIFKDVSLPYNPLYKSLSDLIDIKLLQKANNDDERRIRGVDSENEKNEFYLDYSQAINKELFCALKEKEYYSEFRYNYINSDPAKTSILSLQENITPLGNVMLLKNPSSQNYCLLTPKYHEKEDTLKYFVERGYQLTLISKNLFDNELRNDPKKPYLIKDDEGKYQMWGYKNNKWQLTDMGDLKIDLWKEPEEDPWNPNLIKYPTVFISSSNDLFKALQNGHKSENKTIQLAYENANHIYMSSDILSSSTTMYTKNSKDLPASYSYLISGNLDAHFKKIQEDDYYRYYEMGDPTTIAVVDKDNDTLVNIFSTARSFTTKTGIFLPMDFVATNITVKDKDICLDGFSKKEGCVLSLDISINNPKEKQKFVSATSKEIILKNSDEKDILLDNVYSIGEGAISDVRQIDEIATIKGNPLKQIEDKCIMIDYEYSSVRFLELKGCDFHLMSEIPKDLVQYKNSYILIGKELNYIKNDTTVETVNINDFEKFLTSLKAINKSDIKTIHLSHEQVESLITSNGGHTQQKDSLEPKESLKEVLIKDYESCMEHHITNNQIARILSDFQKQYESGKREFIFNGAVFEIDNRFYFNVAEALEETKGTVWSHPIGTVKSPFNDQPIPCSDFVIRNKETGESFTFSSALIHFIKEYGFFERGPYQFDIDKFMKIFLAPKLDKKHEIHLNDKSSPYESVRTLFPMACQPTSKELIDKKDDSHNIKQNKR